MIFKEKNTLEFDPKLLILNRTDRILKEISFENGVNYISPIDILCEQGSCIYQLGAKPSDLMSYDGQHVSKRGAEFFIDKIKSDIFFVSYL